MARGARMPENGSVDSDRGLQLKLLRISRGIRQYEVAAAVRVCPGILSQMENGQRPVPEAMATRIREVIESAQPEGATR